MKRIDYLIEKHGETREDFAAGNTFGSRYENLKRMKISGLIDMLPKQRAEELEADLITEIIEERYDNGM